MKTLLTVIIILFSFGLNAQTDTVKLKITPPEGIPEYTNFAIDMVRDITLDLLLEYKTHCYNDSVTKTFYRYMTVSDGGYDPVKAGDTLVFDSPNLKTYSNYSLLQTIITYKHQEPTFEGFINWLKNQ